MFLTKDLLSFIPYLLLFHVRNDFLFNIKITDNIYRKRLVAVVFLNDLFINICNSVKHIHLRGVSEL